MVKISVLVPVYNVECYLKESILSILNQTFDNFEVICVNDGSTDNSLNILNNLKKLDSRIKIYNKENGGCGSARNTALDNANGDFIYFFDPDDYLLPNAFENLFNNITKNNSDFVMFKIARFNNKGIVDYSNPIFDFDKYFSNVDFCNFTFSYKDIKPYVLNSGFAPWSKLYNKKFLNKYDDFRFDVNIAFDDVPFHVKSLLRAKKISFEPNFYYFYRYDNPNSVNNTNSNNVDIIKIIDIVENFLKKEGYFDEFINEFYDFKINQIVYYIKNSYSQDFFQLSKEKLLQLNFDDIPNYLTEEYCCIVESMSYHDYDLKLQLMNIKKQKKELLNENQVLKKNIIKNNIFNNNLISSKSWKITKPLRVLSNFFIVFR